MVATDAEPRITTEANSNDQRRMSLETIDAVSSWSGVLAVWFTALAALAGCIAWYFAGLSAKAKEDSLERFKKSADTRIAVSEEQAAKAHATAAETNERAAILAKEAAEARLELERLKSRLAWRTITDEDATKFVAFVAAAPKCKTPITYLTNDEEVAGFVMQLAQLLRRAGYEAPSGFSEMTSRMPIGGVMVGIILNIKDANDQAAIALQRGLEAIGIDAPARLRSQQNERIEIDVGAKPDTP